MRAITQETIQNLNYVKVANPQIDLSHFPDFLIIGPQRTGTTWLYYNLRTHPQIFFSRPKEIFYFNLLNMPDFPRYQSNELAWYLNFFYENPVGYLWKNIKALKNYQEFYKPQIRGEATASYAAMDVEIIRDLVSLKPDIKIILMIRNPIDRAWSHAKLHLLRHSNKKFAEISEQDFNDFFNHPYNLSCGVYTKMINNWSAFLKKENFFIGFYDDIEKRPEELLSNIFSFLGIDNDSKYNKFARAFFNATESIKIPEKYSELLENIFQNEIDELNQRFGLSWPIKQGSGET